MKKIFPIIIAASVLILFLTRPHPPAPPNLGAPASLPAPNPHPLGAPASLPAPNSSLHSPQSTLPSPRSLSKTLTRDQLKPLYTFLSVKQDQDANQLGHALKSDLMDALCAQTVLPIDLTQLLIQIYHDHTQNPVIRDYALQHLATLHQTLGAPGPLEPPGTPPFRRQSSSLDPGAPPSGRQQPFPSAEIESQRAAITTILSEALAETDSSIAGTALLSLHHIADPQDAPNARIADTALKLARDPNTGPPRPHHRAPNLRRTPAKRLPAFPHPNRRHRPRPLHPHLRHWRARSTWWTR